jgi:hypothetical protein
MSGRIIGQGVSDTVSPSGAASAVGNSNGITVISNGRLPATMSSRSPGADRPWAGHANGFGCPTSACATC